MAYQIILRENKNKKTERWICTDTYFDALVKLNDFIKEVSYLLTIQEGYYEIFLLENIGRYDEEQLPIWEEQKYLTFTSICFNECN